jgi:hypothetical protein
MMILRSINLHNKMNYLMKNTIKTLVIIGGLLQGSVSFAADLVSANINAGGKFAYTLKVADGIQAKCSDVKLPQGKNGHLDCQFMKASLSKAPKVLFTISQIIEDWLPPRIVL